jgi:parvulin-like peptidyl-prolyl isomerase
LKSSRLFLSSILLLLGAGASLAQDYNIIATVNGAGIARDRLQTRVDATIEQSGLNYGGITRPQQFKQMQRQALDLLIAQELLWQTAEREGFVADAAEMDAAYAEVRRNFPTDQAFANYLRKNAFTEATFREDLRRRISIRKWAYGSLGETIHISAPDIHEYFVANQVRFLRPEEINVRHVLIRVPADADETTTAAARERIDNVLKQAQAGSDFSDLAKNYSEGPSASNGGDLGFASRGALVQPFEDAAFALEIGQISGVIRTGFGFHIIKLIDRRGGHTLPESEVAPAIRQYLFEDRLLAAMAEKVEHLREKASVEIYIPF